jgi:hypothetical protein
MAGQSPTFDVRQLCPLVLLARPLRALCRRGVAVTLGGRPPMARRPLWPPDVRTSCASDAHEGGRQIGAAQLAAAAADPSASVASLRVAGIRLLPDPLGECLVSK